MPETKEKRSEVKERKNRESHIRVCTMELTGLSNDDFKRWRELTDICREVTNCVWQTWLLWHVQNGSLRQQKEFLAAKAAWDAADKATRGDKPKPPMDAVPPECSKFIYQTVAAQFPTLNVRSTTLLMNTIVGKIKTRKAASGNLPGWVSILFYRESLPSTVRDIPIPFDKASCLNKEPLLPPDPNNPEDQWKLQLRIDRVESEGKSRAGSTLDIVKMWSKGRKVAGQVAILKKIYEGEYEFCGSNVIYKKGKKKWFVAICYRAPRPAAADTDPEKIAFLRPCQYTSVSGLYDSSGRRIGVQPIRSPWKLRMPKRNRRPGFHGGGGSYATVGGTRRRIIAQRISRQRAYRDAGSSNKGHGRDRALQPIWKLQQRWKDFVKTYNYTMAKDVVEQCKYFQCGVLYYFQPAGSMRDSRFLATDGKSDEFYETSGWDWYQMGHRLANLCEVAGIDFRWIKGDRARPERVVKTDTKNARLRKAGSKSSSTKPL